MTKNTFRKILAFGISIIAITTLLIVSVFYSCFKSQVTNNLNAVMSIVQAELEQNGSSDFINNSFSSQTRITLIAPDGTVLADSVKDASLLENHSSRQEIADALNNGEAYAIRKSATLDESVYYYARVMDNGNVLRVSENVQSVFSILQKVLLYIGAVFIFVCACAVFVSKRVTKSIVKPVEELGNQLDDIDDIETYAELKPFVNALREQNKKQKELDKQKKQFTANVSHELKTPLTSIAGYAELIETGIAKEPDVKPFAGIIRKQALRLVSLSEDIIKLSQLDESDDKDIAFASVDLYAVCEKCKEVLEINAKLKNVSFNLCGESAFIKANASLLEELIYNLCDNAIRYNKENGSVDVSVSLDGDNIVLTVSDTGIGIDEKYQERIFERFFRVDKSRSKATGGTGLGLAIVKHIAQIHNAYVNIDSVLGKGTNISVIFQK